MFEPISRRNPFWDNQSPSERLHEAREKRDVAKRRYDDAVRAYDAAVDDLHAYELHKGKHQDKG